MYGVTSVKQPCLGGYETG